MKKIILTVFLSVLLISVKAYADTEWASKFNNKKYICNIKDKKDKVRLDFLFNSVFFDTGGKSMGHFDATDTEDIYRQVFEDKNFYILFNRKANIFLYKELHTKKLTGELRLVNCVDFNNLD